MGAQWIVDRETAWSKIYTAIRQHSKGGRGSAGGPDRERHNLAPSLEAEKEKSLILLNRAADSSSKLVLVM